jgi:hypothetical protein
MHNLTDNVKIDQALGYYAAAQNKVTTDILDMAGYDGVVFIAGFGTLIENGTLDVYPEQNTANSASGMAEIAGTAAYTVAAAALTKSCIIVDVYKPQERYVQCNITPATQNAVILGIVAIRYGGNIKPDAFATLDPLKMTQLFGAAEA